MEGRPQISLSLYVWVALLMCFLSIVYMIIKWLTTSTNSKTRWWREEVLYHIYPRSFHDSSGDGNGDIQGIITKLDYLQELGVNVLYLSPIFQSPMVDNGYDISDFNSINNLFGNMQDFDELLEDVHRRGLKIVLDFVPNHTSDQHPWFQESRQGILNPKRDWYIWRDPGKDGGPPNNWTSVFGGSSWTLDPLTNQYYLHQFYKEQPDLNFREPSVVEAMENVLRFWFDKGVDGFRVDAVPHLFEDEEFKDEPILPGFDPLKPTYDCLKHINTYDLDEVHPVIRRWKRVCLEYKDSYRLLIGEITVGSTKKYYGTKQAPEFDFPFNFTFVNVNNAHTAADIHKMIMDYLSSLPNDAWPNWLLGNHDVSRIGTRVGQHYTGIYQILLLTLPGTPIMYYGDEIGMLDAKLDDDNPGDFRDPFRTPFPWNSSKNSGFSPGKNTWLPVCKNFEENNIEIDCFNSTSLLNLCCKMLYLRNKTKAFTSLGFEVVHVDRNVLAYKRFYKTSVFLVALNFGKSSWAWGLDNISGLGTVVIDSTTIKEPGTKINVKEILLHSGQALVLEMN